MIAECSRCHGRIEWDRRFRSWFHLRTDSRWCHDANGKRALAVPAGGPQQ